MWHVTFNYPEGYQWILKTRGLHRTWYCLQDQLKHAPHARLSSKGRNGRSSRNGAISHTHFDRCPCTPHIFLLTIVSFSLLNSKWLGSEGWISHSGYLLKQSNLGQRRQRELSMPHRRNRNTLLLHGHSLNEPHKKHGF